jgi:hypothetical protein
VEGVKVRGVKMDQHITVYLGKDNLQNRVATIRDSFINKEKISLQLGEFKTEVQLYSVTFHRESNGWYLDCQFFSNNEG